jgi:hypothetical protein
MLERDRGGEGMIHCELYQEHGFQQFYTSGFSWSNEILEASKVEPQF